VYYDVQAAIAMMCEKGKIVRAKTCLRYLTTQNKAKTIISSKCLTMWLISIELTVA
jgi:hypothetical protein